MYGYGYRDNPWEAQCVRSYERGHRLTAADRHALPDEAFGLIAREQGRRVRKYPMPDAAHAANAKARASAALREGYLTQGEHSQIVLKADAILDRCGGALAPLLPFARPRRRVAANPKHRIVPSSQISARRGLTASTYVDPTLRVDQAIARAEEVVRQKHNLLERLYAERERILEEYGLE